MASSGANGTRNSEKSDFRAATEVQLLESLSCPFTWQMEKLLENNQNHADDSDQKIKLDLEDYFPEVTVMHHIMIAYEQHMRDSTQSALSALNEAKNTLDNLIKQRLIPEDVETVLNHIYIGTKYHVLQKSNCLEDMRALVEDVCTKMNMTNEQLAVLYECECIAWLFYHSHTLECLRCAEKATEHDPHNGKCFFLLGRILRRKRRRHDSSQAGPDQNERSAFQKAWELSRNALFGVSLAQMYRESKEYDLASTIYEQIYQMRPTSCKVQNQLALGFIRNMKPNLAKQCLDYVAARMPECTTYLHYMGMYQQKCMKNVKAAVSFYERAADNGNYRAEFQYMRCRKWLDRAYNPLPRLLGLLEEDKTTLENEKLEIYVHIASYYLFGERDLVKACEFVKKAIDINPAHHFITVHYSLYHNDSVNIYDELLAQLDGALSSKRPYSESELSIIMIMMKDMRRLCNRHYLETSETTAQFSPGRGSDAHDVAEQVSRMSMNPDNIQSGPSSMQDSSIGNGL